MSLFSSASSSAAGSGPSVTVPLPPPAATPRGAGPAAPGANPASNSSSCTDKLRGAYDFAKDKVEYLGREVEKFTDKHLPKDISKLVATILKVMPFALLLLITPMSIVMTTVAIGASIVIIRPVIADRFPHLFGTIARIIGTYSALHAIKEALMISFSAYPQIHLIACVVHMVITAACFKTADKYSPLDPQHDSLQAAVGLDTGAEGVEGAAQRGRGSAAPASAPEPEPVPLVVGGASPDGASPPGSGAGSFVDVGASAGSFLAHGGDGTDS